MGKNQEVSYVCDRCGKQESEPDMDQRKKWFNIENDWNSYNDKKYLVCTACHRDLIEWINKGLPKLAKMVRLGGAYR